MSVAVQPARRSRGQTILLLVCPALLLVAAPALVLGSTGMRATPGLQAALVTLGVLPLVTPLVLRMVGRTWDPLLLSPAWVLCAFGLAVIARVQPAALATQMLWISLGWSSFIALAGFPGLLDGLRRFRYLLIASGLLLGGATLLLGADVTGQGARLWLRIGSITVQPAELLRILLVAFLAGHLAEHPAHEAWRGSRGQIPTPGFWLPILGVLAVTVLLVVAQRDFGPALIFGASAIATLYAATRRRDYILVAVLAAAALAMLAYFGSDRIQGRVEAWADPWSDPRGAGYQSLQAIGGLVFGGVFGAGPGYGNPGLIPAAHTDYPLAVIGEEWGLLGSLAVVMLYGLFVVRALARARVIEDAFGRLLSVGLAVSLGAQVLIVFSGVLRLMPITGLTSPFLSYGGSSMVVGWVMLALLTGAGANEDGRPPGASHAEAPIRELGFTLLAGFLVVSLGLGYWHVLRHDLASHPAVSGERLRRESDRVARGRILDRNGQVLAETVTDPGGERRRVYRTPGLVHVLGFDSAQVGTAGVEGIRADALVGRTAPTLRSTWQDLLHERRNGEDVRLTIDSRIQQAAEKALGNTPGAVVAIDPRTGDVLAMVSTPAFNPAFSEEEWAALRRDPKSPLLNRATQGLYAPGSTFKTVTLAAALEHHLVEAQTPVSCLEQVFVEGVRIVSRNELPGKKTANASDAYAYSCNTFFAELGVRLGADRLREASRAFGLTESIPFALPTVAGRLSTAPKFLDSDAGLAASAFGQGELQFTPLHLALVTAAVGNGGVVPRPRLFLDEPTEDWRRAMSPATAEALREMMEHGVQDGWASTVAIPGLRVGGKTGSAEVAPGDNSHALFIAFAPVEDAQIAIAVVKEFAGSGSQQAGPVARAVIDAWNATRTEQPARPR